VVATADYYVGANASAAVSIADNDAPPLSLSLLQVTGLPFTAQEGVDTGPITLATFTDTDPLTTPADYLATVRWGDVAGAAPVPVTVVPTGPGTFAVQAGHTYLLPGAYRVEVTVVRSDLAGAVPTTVTLTAEVEGRARLSGSGVTLEATRCVWLPTDTVIGWLEIDLTQLTEWEIVYTGTDPNFVGNLIVTDPNPNPEFVYELLTQTDKFSIVGNEIVTDQEFTDTNLTYQETFTITVKPPPPPSDLQLSDNTVLTYQPPGTVVGNLIVTDPNPDPEFVYELLTHTDKFSIVGNEIVTEEVFNNTATQNYQLLILVTNTDTNQTGLVALASWIMQVFCGSSSPRVDNLLFPGGCGTGGLSAPPPPRCHSGAAGASRRSPAPTPDASASPIASAAA
jgi:hypothetical protein